MENNQSWEVFIFLGFGNSFRNFLPIVAVFYLDNIPACCKKAEFDVIGCGIGSRPVESRTIFVVKQNQFVEMVMSRKRNGFVGNPLFQTPITTKAIGPVIHDFGAFGIFGFNGFFRHRHPHGLGNSLSQWPAGSVYSRSHSHFRVARSNGAQLTERLQVFHAYRIAEAVKRGIKQGGNVTARKYETITVNPIRMFGVGR